MKKRVFICSLLVCLIACFMSSCGVSQAEYDKVVAERDELRALLDAAEEQSSVGGVGANDDSQNDIIVEPEDNGDNSSAQPEAPISHTMVGETVTTDKLNITLLDCMTMERVYESTISYYQASDGMKYAILPFRIENISSNDEQLSSHFDFAYYADNVLCHSKSFGYWPPNVNGYAAIDRDDVVVAGRVIEGYVVCEVPLDAQVLEIEYEGFVFECALN